MTYPRYPVYRWSGVEWLGEVPEHWGVLRLKYLVSLRNDKVSASGTEMEYLGLENIQSGTGRLVEGKSEESAEGTANRFFHGDVLFGKLRPYLAKAFAADKDGLASTETFVMTPKEFSQRFLFYLVLSPTFVTTVDSTTYGSKMPRANWEDVGNMPWCLPPLDEQRAIAAFLDRETAQIDALIAKLERLIALLQEKRQALISHAVTKGLDPTVPMKDSGVEWLGEVPEHWEVVQSRRYFRLRNESPIPGDRQLTAAQKYGVIYQDDFVELEGRRVVEVIKGGDILKRVVANDFVISMRSFQGGIEYSANTGSISSAYVVLEPLKNIEVEFFRLLFKSGQYIQALQSTSNLVRDGQALRYGNFTQVDIPLPPEDEQIEIASFVEGELKTINHATYEIQRLIGTDGKGGVLGERRAALITAAVTGSIDVRDSQ